MPEDVDVYRKLQKHVDQMPVGFPETSSGVEIRILKHLFTPQEAEIALALSALPESLERIHSRLGHLAISLEELESTLDRMVAKGAILGGRWVGPKGAKRYSKAMLAIGMYELQVDRLTPDFQRDVRQYMEEAFAEAFHAQKTSQMRTIPIHRSLVPEHHVGLYDDAKALIRNSDGPFAVLNCVCRQGADLLGQPCRQTDIRRTCLVLKDIAQGLIEAGVGHALTRAQTLDLVATAEDRGMVLQPENTKDPTFICFCCGCCCGVLTMIKKFPRPAEYVHSNYQARVDGELCTACGTCATRCQMEAVRTADDGSVVDLDRCIGCGLCVTTCPSGAMRLEKKPAGRVPPRDSQSLYRTIWIERFGPWGTIKMLGKGLLGMKI